MGGLPQVVRRGTDSSLVLLRNCKSKHPDKPGDSILSSVTGSVGLAVNRLSSGYRSAAMDGSTHISEHRIKGTKAK